MVNKNINPIIHKNNMPFQAIDVSTLGTSVDFEQTDLQKELNVKKKTIDF